MTTTTLSHHIVLFILQASWIASYPFGRRGFGRTARFLAQYVPSHLTSLTTTIHTKSLFTVPLHDAYWVPLLFPRYRYEPEIQWLLDRIITEEMIFLDCGANSGYWTLRAAETISDHTRIVSVEASEQMAERLRQNIEDNSVSSHLLVNALDGVSGETLVLRTVGTNHAGASVCNTGDTSGAEVHEQQVTTVTLDDIYHTIDDRDGRPVIVKLDVEGKEVSSMAGAEDLLQQDCLIIYEDLHAGESSLSEYFLERGTHTIYTHDKQDIVSVITDKTAVDRYRTRIHGGANFFACTTGSTFDTLLASLTTAGKNVTEG